MWKEFKEFAFKGNVLDMSIGVIIGGAFGKIVTSLVNDIIMPFFGFLTAGTDFKTLKFILSPAQVDAAGAVIKPEAAIMYGNFLQNVFDFFIIAFCIFFLVNQITKMRKKLIHRRTVKNMTTVTDFFVENGYMEFDNGVAIGK